MNMFLSCRPGHTVIKVKFTDYIQNIHMLRDGLTVFLHFLNIVNQLPAEGANLTAGISHTECIACHIYKYRIAT